jgi:hypothetical protein
MADRSDEQAMNGDPEFDEDAAGDRAAPKTRPLDRLRSNAPSAKGKPLKWDRSTKWAIDRLDDRERRFSFIGAAGAALFGTIIYFSETNAHKPLAKGQVSPQTTLLLGLGAAALLLIATLIGRRAPVGFVALFTFLALGPIPGLPFLALAAWLLYRSWKVQREASANVRSARSESSRSASSGSNPSRAIASKGPNTASSKSARQKGPAGPEANKRYTPKRPPPPAPKPSRRQRKASQASD